MAQEQERAKVYLKQFESLSAERNTFDGVLREMAYYARPSERDFQTRTGSKNHYDTYKIPHSSIAIKSSKTLANGIYSNSVPAGSKWFNLNSTNPEVNGMAVAKTHFAKARDVVTRQLQMSNFALETGEMLQRYTSLGTGVVFPVYDKKRRKFVFKSHSIVDVYIAENEERMVDTVARTFFFTAKQAYQKWGDDNSPKIIEKALSDKQDDKHEFIHIIRPRLKRDENRLDAKNMAFESTYIDKEHKHIVSEGGFKEFPFQVPRFYIKDDSAYGLPPTYDALPELRLLDRGIIDFYDAVELSMRPPVFTSDMETVEGGEIEAGTINFIREGAQFQQLESRGRVDIGDNFIEKLKEEVKEMFFVNLFLSLDQQAYRTATEVSRADTEKFQSIAAFTQRLQTEYFTPLIKRVYNLCVENDLIQVPPELQDVDLNIAYVNNIDALLNQNEIASLMNALNQAGQFEQTVSQLPETKAKIKMSEGIDYIFEANNVSTDMIRSESEYKKHKAAELQAQQQASQEAMMMEKMGQVDPNKAPEDGSIASAVGGMV